MYTGKDGKAGPTGKTEAQVAHVKIDGETALAQIAKTGVPPTKTLKLSFKPGTNKFSVHQTCPSGCTDCDDMSQEYTATPTTFVVIGDGPEKYRVRTFTKR